MGHNTEYVCIIKTVSAMIVKWAHKTITTRNKNYIDKMLHIT